MSQFQAKDVLKQAQALYETGQLDAVIELLQAQLPHIRHHEVACLAYLTLSRAFYEKNQFIKGVEVCTKALELFEELDHGWYELGLHLIELGCYEKANKAFEKAIEINNKDSRYYLNLALTLKELRHFREAKFCYDLMIQRFPNKASLYRNKTTCVTYHSTSNSDFTYLSQLIKNPLSRADDKMHAYYGLVKIYHDCKMYERAQNCAELANSLRAKIFPFKADVLETRIENIISSFKHCLAHSAKHYDITPIFIVGLSRSGKSLLESILNTHDKVFVKRECRFLGYLIPDYLHEHQLNAFYPEGLAHLIEHNLKSFSDKFYNLLSYGVEQGKKYVIDTTPQNIEHIGLLKLLFPNAKFIACHRNFNDNALKIYFKYYNEGNSYAHSIEDIRAYYLQTQKLLQFWEQDLNIDIHHVYYKMLVAKTEQVISDVAQFINLDDNFTRWPEIHQQEVGIAKHYPNLILSGPD